MSEETKNTKIMVNFTKKKVIHTNEPVNSQGYEDLINGGYVQVGTMKGTGQFFWNHNFFEPRAKYGKREDNNSTDTITT